MVAVLRRFQPPLSTARNARMELHFGGCFRQGLRTKRPPNFIDAQSATTLGGTTPSRPRITLSTTILYDIFSLQFRSGFLAELVEEVVWWSSIISNDAGYLDSLVEHSGGISEERG